MQGFIILCDFAEELNGKLYIMGGGWSRLMKVRPTVNISLAAKLLVPWNSTNSKTTLSVDLLTEDGQPLLLGDPARPVRMAGDFEVGRPPGVPAGSDIDVPLAFRIDDLPLEIGRYRWELSVGAEKVAEVVFDIVAP